MGIKNIDLPFDVANRLVEDWREWRCMGNSSQIGNIFHEESGFSALYNESTPPTATELMEFCTDNAKSDQHLYFMLESIACDFGVLVLGD